MSEEPYTSYRVYVHEQEWNEMAARGIVVRQRETNPALREAIRLAYRCSLFSNRIPPADIEFESGAYLSMVFDDGLNH